MMDLNEARRIAHADDAANHIVRITREQLTRFELVVDVAAEQRGELVRLRAIEKRARAVLTEVTAPLVGAVGAQCDETVAVRVRHILNGAAGTS